MIVVSSGKHTWRADERASDGQIELVTCIKWSKSLEPQYITLFCCFLLPANTQYTGNVYAAEGAACPIQTSYADWFVCSWTFWLDTDTVNLTVEKHGRSAGKRRLIQCSFQQVVHIFLSSTVKCETFSAHISYLLFFLFYYGTVNVIH